VVVVVVVVVVVMAAVAAATMTSSIIAMRATSAEKPALLPQRVAAVQSVMQATSELSAALAPRTTSPLRVCRRSRRRLQSVDGSAAPHRLLLLPPPPPQGHEDGRRPLGRRWV
jgi:hypothetical protein